MHDHSSVINTSDGPSTRTPTPFSGWALARVIDLDGECSGLLAATFRFGVQRRQALFLILAAIEVHGLDQVAHSLRAPESAPDRHAANAAGIVGHALLQLRRPRDLIRAVLGGSPDGLVGALSRLGPEPIGEPDAYLELARLFFSTDLADRRRVRVLGQISGGLAGAQIKVVCLLDPVLLHPMLVATISEAQQVAELHRALAYIRAHCSRASDEAIRASLSRLRPDGLWPQLIKAWAARFDRLPCTFDTHGDPTLIVLSSASALIDAGRRYENCLKTKIYEVLIGTYLFVEYRPENPGEPGLIAELRRTTQGFVLEGIFARENRRVRSDRACIVRGQLAACGVAILDHAPGDWKALNATARALDLVDFDEPDLAGGWGDEILEATEVLQQIFRDAA